MSDRLFAACCYGSDEQHTDSQPCPQDAPIAAQVTQADRDAAWAIARFYLGNGSGFPDQLRDGRIERHFTLDILAKHRSATGLLAALDAADNALAQVTAFEDGARAIMGNTNFEIVKLERAKVRAAIAKARGAA